MKLVIIDDDLFICRSLQTILQADPSICVAAVGCSGEEAEALYQRHRPDILIMDIQMPGIGGLEAGERILKQDPEAKILYLTTFSDDEYIIRALRSGAKGYLIKEEVESIAPALKAVMSGQSVFGSEIVMKLPQLMAGAGNKEGLKMESGGFDLGKRELEIVGLVAEGLNNREIAEKLFLSEGTVRNYISTVLEKLELRDRTQLAVFYLTGNCGGVSETGRGGV